MIILNFAHPLTSAMLQQIAEQLAVPLESIIEQRISTQINRQLPIEQEITRLTDSSGFDATQWQTVPFVVNPPGLATAALCLIAEIHGRTGYFPSVLNIAAIPNTTPLEFCVLSVCNLQLVREVARSKR